MKNKRPLLSLRLLVADSHEEFRRCLVHYMESQKGLTVVGEACDGVEAIAQANQTRPDLVIINSRLPRIDAWTTAKAIKERLPDTHFIALEICPTSGESYFPPIVESYLERGRIAQNLPAAIAAIREEIRFSRMNHPRAMSA